MTDEIKFHFLTNPKEIARYTLFGHWWFKKDDEDWYCVSCEGWPCLAENADPR